MSLFFQIVGQTHSNGLNNAKWAWLGDSDGWLRRWSLRDDCWSRERLNVLCWCFGRLLVYNCPLSASQVFSEFNQAASFLIKQHHVPTTQQKSENTAFSNKRYYWFKPTRWRRWQSIKSNFIVSAGMFCFRLCFCSCVCIYAPTDQLVAHIHRESLLISIQYVTEIIAKLSWIGKHSVC